MRARLSPDVRREQLADAALEIVARDGANAFSLEDVAERAGVTRNLLYHYFPRGKQDVFLAAVQKSGDILIGGWVTDAELTLDQRLAANFARLREHAGGPSSAWSVYRQARSAGDPEVRAAVAVFVEQAVSNIALNNLGTEEPPALARVAINGFLGFSELALDGAREHGVPEEQLYALLAESLQGVLAAVRKLG